MRKFDIAAQVADRTGLRRTEAAGAVDAVLEAVTEALAQREDFRVAGFGLFASRYRAVRAGHNPRTGEPVAVATTAPALKLTRALHEIVNSGASS